MSEEREGMYHLLLKYGIVPSNETEADEPLVRAVLSSVLILFVRLEAFEDSDGARITLS